MTTTRSDVLKFVKDHVLNISDLTRTSKLAEILELYADKTSDELFVVQNTRNKNGRAVIADLEFFEELLMYRAFCAVLEALRDKGLRTAEKEFSPNNPRRDAVLWAGIDRDPQN